ncbi:MAG: helix-turn-helix transcriptional regulator [Deltaproteobacteria bacterium]|nr:helix-turn-helix transcriptional regulator [Deltaproteobacteria bacterium]
MDEINVQVAERLRRLRGSGGLSLQDLAQRSGVSRAMLSQIETLKTNPTIAVLWKIAAGLGVPFAELLGGAAAPPVRLERAADARYLFSGDRRLRSRPLLAGVPGHSVELYELRLEPGGVEEAAAHPAGSFEQIIVTAGRLRLGVGAESWVLGAGDALLFPADHPHRYETVGRRAFVGLSLILYGA